jgi:hypothetical protein
MAWYSHLTQLLLGAELLVQNLNKTSLELKHGGFSCTCCVMMMMMAMSLELALSKETSCKLLTLYTTLLLSLAIAHKPILSCCAAQCSSTQLTPTAPQLLLQVYLLTKLLHPWHPGVTKPTLPNRPITATCAAPRSCSAVPALTIRLPIQSAVVFVQQLHKPTGATLCRCSTTHHRRHLACSHHSTAAGYLLISATSAPSCACLFLMRILLGGSRSPQGSRAQGLSDTRTCRCQVGASISTSTGMLSQLCGVNTSCVRGRSICSSAPPHGACWDTIDNRRGPCITLDHCPPACLVATYPSNLMHQGSTSRDVGVCRGGRSSDSGKMGDISCQPPGTQALV